MEDELMKQAVQLISLAIVLATFAYVLELVIDKWPSASDAAAVLGVIVPAFASMGAAVFGIQVAYAKGTAAGEASGHERGKKEVARRVLDASGSGDNLGAMEDETIPVSRIREEVARILME